MHYLFVCTGNTCRSPMAEQAFKHLTNRHHRLDEAQSCGLYAQPGLSMMPQAERALTERFGQVMPHQSQPCSSALVQWADVIFVMTKSHAAILKSMLSKADQNKVRLLGFDQEISDPYGFDDETYGKCLDQIVTYLERQIGIQSNQDIAEELDE